MEYVSNSFKPAIEARNKTIFDSNVSLLYIGIFPRNLRLFMLILGFYKMLIGNTDLRDIQLEIYIRFDDAIKK